MKQSSRTFEELNSRELWLKRKLSSAANAMRDVLVQMVAKDNTSSA